MQRNGGRDLASWSRYLAARRRVALINRYLPGLLRLYRVDVQHSHNNNTHLASQKNHPSALVRLGIGSQRVNN
jgi:hypothetical protein